MSELFQWVPWFEELAAAVGTGRREGLVEGAKKVDWAGGTCAVLANGEERADPLTFFYHLGSIAGGKAEKLETVYASVAEVFGIKSELDYGCEDGFIFPTPPGLAVRFNGTGADPELLWKMFDQARGLDGTSYGTDIADTFARTLQVKGVGVPKLTQVLFLTNPRAFLPFDAAAVLPLGIGRFKSDPAKISWDEYVDEMGRIRAAFPGCDCYEINVIGYLWTAGLLPRKGVRWYQVGTRDGEWPDFRDNHWIHDVDQADMDRPREGDVILVRSGTREGRGIGIVYRNDCGEPSSRKDRIHVLWVNKKQAALAADMPATRFSRVGHAAHEAFAKSYSETLRMLEPPPPTNPDPFYALIQSLEKDGLLFPGELVANYILALQTKRFAILTGISGTGKTKIAMALARRFEHSEQRRVAATPADADGREAMPSMLKYSSMILPVAIVDNLNLLGPNAPRAERKIRVRYPAGQAKLTYTRQHQGPTTLVFRGDFKKWFKSEFNEGDHFWLRVIEGETPESDELEFGLPDTEVVETPLDNHVVVPVRPDWVDNRGLLGYLNPLTNEYSTTPFLNLLLRARDEERRAEAAGENPHPFFVILDEMNLARVEHYFSDFLSALESGEDIPLHEDEAVESGESESAGPQVPRTLKVPGNVLFTGTVNVDETTYMFSPKVLDRAFTIEFDRVDLKGFAAGASSEDASGLNLDGIEGSLDLLRSGRSKDGDWKPSREDWVKFSEKASEHQEALLHLHAILEAEHRHFGYRVANEIARFVNLAREQAKDTDAAVDAAIDLALLQKVLPKFHGTQQELESLLEEIFLFAVYRDKHVPKNDRTVKLDDWKVVEGRLGDVSKSKTPSEASSGDGSTASSEADSADAKGADAKAADAGPESPAYPRTGAKVLRMLKRLRDRGFTSFIE